MRRQPPSPARSTSWKSTLSLLRKRGPAGADVPAADEEDAAEEIRALARRAGEIRTELRFLLRADDPTYVYFVEFRGRGVLLRASPIDVSGIIRELLLDKMHRHRADLGDAHGRRRVRLHPESARDLGCRGGATTLGVRLRAPDDPLSSSPYARSAVSGFCARRGHPGDRNSEAYSRPRFCAVHQLRDPTRGSGPRRDGTGLPDFRAGNGTSHAVASAV